MAFFWRLLPGVLLGAVLLGASSSWAEEAVTEQDLKAVLYYKLPVFVYRAPSDQENRVDFCVLGAAQLDNAMGRLPATLLDGRRADIHMLPSHADTGECDFLFIGRSEGSRLDGILRRLSGRRLVTVSDIDGFARAGGMVEFALRPGGSGIQILINRKAARMQGIEFNAQLLRLAKIVEP